MLAVNDIYLIALIVNNAKNQNAKNQNILKVKSQYDKNIRKSKFPNLNRKCRVVQEFVEGMRE